MRGKESRFVRTLGLALLVAFSLPLTAAAVQGVTVKAEHRQEVRNIYKKLKTDPQYQALKAGLKGKMLNRSAVDAYLSYLPISPLEIQSLDRWTGRWLMPVPEYVEVYHERWKQLHPAEAKRFYGADRPRRSEGEGGYEAVAEAILGEGGTKAVTVGSNRNLVHDNPQPPVQWQSEVHISVNPKNPKQMVAASNTFKFPWTCGPRTIQAIYYSGDGGQTWGFTCAPNPLQFGLDCDARGGILNGSDPVLAWNNNNEVFYNYMAICNDGIPRTAILLARSTDGGATWNAQGVVKNAWPTGDFEDKNHLAIDTHPSSPYYGRIYSCWARNANEKVAFSSNNGVSWTEKDIPALPLSNYDIVCDMAIQKNGTVHMMIETANCGEFECFDSWLYHTRSTDGGNTWSTPKLIVDLNFSAFSADACPDAQADRCIISMGSIDIDNSGGPCNGTLYATYAEKPATGNVNNMDIFVRRSTNGGGTWSAPVRVNDDGAGGKVQFFPYLTVDQIKGNPVLAWMDGRNDPNNVAMDVFTSRSTNCGVSFKKNVQVTKPSNEFNNNTISSSNESAANPSHNVNQYGDYIGVDARNAKGYIAWTDSRHYFPAFQTEPQRENIGFAVVTYGPPAPQNIVVTINSSGVRLYWDYSPPTDLSAFNVYRVANGVYTKLGSVAASSVTVSSPSTRTYNDTTATSDGTYAYVVAAVDTAGEEGPYSDPITILVDR